MTSSYELINDLGGVQVERRTRSSGKQHVTLTMTSEPIAVLVDEMELARPVATAIAKAISDGTKAITEVASKATIKAREKARKAFDKGEGWALRRYSGGRMGAMPPHQSDKYGTDSGRLANGITANPNPSSGGFTINAPVNRLKESEFRPGAFTAFVTRWHELVAALRNPLEDIGVQRTLRKVAGARHQKLAMAAAEKQSKLVLDVVKLIGRLVA